MASHNYNFGNLDFDIDDPSAQWGGGSNLDLSGDISMLDLNLYPPIQTSSNFIPNDNSEDNLSLEDTSSAHSITTAPASNEYHSDSANLDEKTLKRERNKASAAKYRQKKKTQMATLEQEVDELRNQLYEKNTQVVELETQNRLLREQLSFFQKLFAVATNNPMASSSALALGVVILLAFVLPVNFNPSGLNSFSRINPPQYNNNPIHLSQTQAPGTKVPGVGRTADMGVPQFDADSFAQANYAPVNHQRRILQAHCMLEEVDADSGLMQLRIQPHSEFTADRIGMRANVTWIAEFPQYMNDYQEDSSVCRVLSLQEVRNMPKGQCAVNH